MGAEHTFAQDLIALGEARMWLMRLTEKVSARLRAHALEAQTITVKIRVPPFETLTRQAQLHPASANTNAIFHLAEQLLVTWWNTQKRPSLRLLGLSASRFDLPLAAPETRPQQADLFAPAAMLTPPGSVAISATDQLNDAINKKFGAHSLRRARALAVKE